MSGIVVTTLGLVLCLMRIEPNEDNLKIRIARWILVASYFLLSVPDWLNIYGANDSGDKTAATIVAASIQALLFTFTLITMIQPRLVTRKRMAVNVALVSVGAVAFLVVDSLAGSLYVTGVSVAAVIFQMSSYIRLFRRCYDRYVEQIADYYDDEQRHHLLWARNSFYAALAIGILAIVSLLLPQAAYNAFMCVYMAFYIWFASRFINYVTKLNYYLPAVSLRTEEEDTDTILVQPVSVGTPSAAAVESPDAPSGDETGFKERMDKVIEEYVAGKDYLEPEHDRNWIITRSGTDLRFFRWYFQDVFQCDFRTWRANLRIEEAKRFIETTPGVSMNVLALKLGFGTSQNFYHHFKKVVGMTPTEYLAKIEEDRKSDGR